MASVRFTFPYLAMNDVMRTLKDSEARIVEQQFDNSCMIQVSIRSDHAQDLMRRISDISGTSLEEDMP